MIQLLPFFIVVRGPIDKQSAYSSGDGDFYGHWNHPGHDASVEGAHEVERVIVGVHEGHSVSGLDVDLRWLEPDPVEEGVSDFMGPAQKLA